MDTIGPTRGGFLPELELDAEEFGLAPHVAACMDMAQFLALRICADALVDAGYGFGQREFDRNRASVILGAFGLTRLAVVMGMRLSLPVWRRALAAQGVASETIEAALDAGLGEFPNWERQIFPGLLGNIISGRVAHCLDLRGSNYIIDAACTSSLASVHACVLELESGRADLALAGGVDILNDIFMFMCFHKTGILSLTGDARPFGHDADGSVPGEGGGALVLKRLEDAQRDGDRIHAVIRSVAMSSDGRTRSIYAPDSRGQARALQAAYDEAGLDPAKVEFAEAHGTGTIKGDPIELQTLATVFCPKDGRRVRPLRIGSVKSQIGHAKAAAGIAGLIKAVMAVKHGVFLPTLKAAQANPNFDWSLVPIVINHRSRPWLRRGSEPRRAGINAFAFGGCNAHAIVEEYGHGEGAPPAWDGSVELLAVSGSSIQEVLAKLRRVHGELEGGKWGDRLARIFAHCRKEFASDQTHRLVAVLQKDLGEAAEQVNGVLRRLEGLTLGEEEQVELLPGAWVGVGQPFVGSVVAVVPGYGLTRPGLFRDLFCTFRELTEPFAEERSVSGPALLDELFDEPGLEGELDSTVPLAPMASLLAEGFGRLLGGKFGIPMSGPVLLKDSADIVDAIDAADVIIEVGPIGMVRGHVGGDIRLAGPLVVPLDGGAESCGIAALGSALAQLAALGVPVDLGAWEEDRGPEPPPPRRPLRFNGARLLTPVS
jgi:3-oxoacyl-(acyl-carrier-protein) synthase